MENIQIDWSLVVIAAVVNMIIGWIWYSKWLFGPAWAKLSKHSEKEMKGSGVTVFYGFLISLVTAYFLAFFGGYLGVTSVTDGMYVGFLFWLGFVATTQISSVVWCKKPFNLFVLNTAYKLLSFLVMSGIIGS